MIRADYRLNGRKGIQSVKSSWSILHPELKGHALKDVKQTNTQTHSQKHTHTHKHTRFDTYKAVNVRPCSKSSLRIYWFYASSLSSFSHANSSFWYIYQEILIQKYSFTILLLSYFYFNLFPKVNYRQYQTFQMIFILSHEISPYFLCNKFSNQNHNTV